LTVKMIITLKTSGKVLNQSFYYQGKTYYNNTHYIR